MVARTLLGWFDLQGYASLPLHKLRWQSHSQHGSACPGILGTDQVMGDGFYKIRQLAEVGEKFPATGPILGTTRDMSNNAASVSCSPSSLQLQQCGHCLSVSKVSLGLPGSLLPSGHPRSHCSPFLPISPLEWGKEGKGLWDTGGLQDPKRPYNFQAGIRKLLGRENCLVRNALIFSQNFFLLLLPSRKHT